MITRTTYTLTYEREGQRIRDEITRWALFWIIPIYSRRVEVWRNAAVVTDELRIDVLTVDDNQCVYCGCTDRAQLAIDHRLPQSRGGLSAPANLLTACKRCNSAKRDRTPEEANMPLLYGRFWAAGIAYPNARHKVYFGIRNEYDNDQVWPPDAFVRDGTEGHELVCPADSHDCVLGFEWGPPIYGATVTAALARRHMNGPENLAYAILLDLGGESLTVYAPQFAQDALSQLPKKEGFTIYGWQIVEWVRRVQHAARHLDETAPPNVSADAVEQAAPAPPIRKRKPALKGVS